MSIKLLKHCIYASFFLISNLYAQKNLTAKEHFLHGVSELRGENSSPLLANEHFSRAIDMGHIPAMKALADSYYSGDGVKKNLARALILYIMAADSGYGPAQFSAGAMLMKGEGGKLNRGLAFFYLELASLNDDLDELRQDAAALRDEVKKEMNQADISCALNCINHYQNKKKKRQKSKRT